MTWLRVAEVLALDLEYGTAELWYHLRSRKHSAKKWDEPMSRLSCLLTIQNISTSEIEGCLMSSPRGRGCRIYSGEEAR